MTIYQFLQRGEYHADFCEDSGVVQPLGEHKLVCAVLDGCTMGQESHFAAALGVKLLRKAVKEYHYQQLYQPAPATLPEEVRLLVAGVFRGFQEARNHLLLATPELLTTLAVALLDTTSREAAPSSSATRWRPLMAKSGASSSTTSPIIWPTTSARNLRRGTPGSRSDYS